MRRTLSLQLEIDVEKTISRYAWWKIIFIGKWTLCIYTYSIPHHVQIRGKITFFLCVPVFFSFGKDCAFQNRLTILSNLSDINFDHLFRCANLKFPLCGGHANYCSKAIKQCSISVPKFFRNNYLISSAHCASQPWKRNYFVSLSFCNWMNRVF